MVNLFLIDDHPLILEGFKNMLHDSPGLTHFAANQTIIAVDVGFHFFCVPLCVLQIFF